MRRLILTLLGLALLTVSVAAQGEVSPEAVEAVIEQLSCPLCGGIPLAECDLPVCDDMREIIVERLAAGESEEQIIAYFVEQYGEQVLIVPPRRGFSLLVWVLPGLAIIIGGMMVWWALRRLAAPSPALSSGSEIEGGEPPPAVEDEYLARVERELRELE